MLFPSPKTFCWQSFIGIIVHLFYFTYIFEHHIPFSPFLFDQMQSNSTHCTFKSMHLSLLNWLNDSKTCPWLSIIWPHFVKLKYQRWQTSDVKNIAAFFWSAHKGCVLRSNYVVNTPQQCCVILIQKSRSSMQKPAVILGGSVCCAEKHWDADRDRLSEAQSHLTFIVLESLMTKFNLPKDAKILVSSHLNWEPHHQLYSEILQSAFYSQQMLNSEKGKESKRIYSKLLA